MKEDLSVSEPGSYVGQGRPDEDSFVSAASSAIDTPEHILRTPVQPRTRSDDPLPQLRKAAQEASATNLSQKEPINVPRWAIGAAIGGVLTMMLAGFIATSAMLIAFQLFRADPEVVEEGERTHKGIPVREGLGKD